MNTFRLLLVDDEERFLSTTQTILRKKGIEISVASNGLDALKLLEDRPFDVVVLDLKMPGLSGLDILRKIKRRHPLVEVILLTGHGTLESAVEGLKQGAFEYLLKPCSIDNLLKKIETAVARKRINEEQKQKNKIDKIISHPLAVFDDDET